MPSVPCVSPGARPGWSSWLDADQSRPSFLPGCSLEIILRTIMSALVITVSEDTELGEIARLFVTHRIKRVPVVRDGGVTGIVAREDLVRALLQPG